MFVNDSMMAALQTRGGFATTALLIIDEEDNAAPNETSTTPGMVVPGSNVTACQQRLVMYMQRMGSPIWSIRFLQGFPSSNDGPDNTRTALRALYDGTEHLLRKPHPNAFRDTDLHQELQQLHIQTLVVMGWHANACVNATVGSQWWPVGTVDDGATHLGYTVLTCNQILHGGPATWSNPNPAPAHYANLEFYQLF